MSDVSDVSIETVLERQLHAATAAISKRTTVVPRVALVLGSGLGTLAGEVSDATSIAYDEIPHFPRSTAPGHAGELILGNLEGTSVAVLSGRSHLYEGRTPAEIAFPVRAMRGLGAEILLVTNAAGGVNLDYRPGDLMLITDHINLTGHSPLIGPNLPGMGPRFPDMSEAYDPALREVALRVSSQCGVPLREGVYLGLTGPSFETPAEIRMARMLGADAVGMSTVLEVLAAVHCGMRTLGISCITNMAAGVLPTKLSEQDVFATAEQARPWFAQLLRDLVRELGIRDQASNA